MTNVGRALPIGLFLVFALLCTAIGFEITDPAPDPQFIPVAGTVAPPRINTPAMDGLSDQHDTWFREILARPLFSPDRKPPASVAHSVAGLPRLTGIVVSGSRRIAIFASNAGGRPVVVEAGSRIGAYDVRDIADGGVTVVGPEGTTVVRPIFDPSAPVAAKPGAAVRPDLLRPAPK